MIANRADNFYQTYGEQPDYEMHESDASVPNLLKYSAWSGGNIELVNGGDEVILLDSENSIADGLSWGNSNVIIGSSRTRLSHRLTPSNAAHPTGIRITREDWVDQENPSPGIVDLSMPTPTTTSTPERTPMPPELITLLISEVVYNPVVEPEGEWFEIYNYGENGFSLAGLRIGDEETKGSGEGMLVFPNNCLYRSRGDGGYRQPGSDVQSSNGFYPDYEMNNSDPAVADMLRDLDWGSGSVALQNSGDELILLDEMGLPWMGSRTAARSAILDPPVPGVELGHSLERYPPGHGYGFIFRLA